MKKLAVDRLMEAVKKEDGGCWEWQRSVTSEGYGQIRIDWRSWRTHRLAFDLFVGPLRRDILVCHTCDNRRCCNSDHLFLGDMSDNLHDAAAKGRGAKTKLQPENVREIRSLYRRGVNRRHPGNSGQLAKRFGVTSRTVLSAAKGDTFQWIS